MFDSNQTGMVAGGTTTATFSANALTSDTCTWAGVIINPRYAQPLASDVRCPAV